MERTDYPEPVVLPRLAQDTRDSSLTFHGVSPTLPTVAQGSPDDRASNQHFDSSQHQGLRDERPIRLSSTTSTGASQPASRNASLVPSLSTSLSNLSEWREDPFPEFRLRGSPKVYQILLPWEASSVGLSSECTSAFFFRERTLAVVSLARVQAHESQQRIVHTFNDRGRLREVSASGHYIVALTDEWLTLLRYHFSATGTAHSLDILGWVSMEWDPKGLAIHESSQEVLIVAGERRQGLGGRVKLYRFALQNNPGRRIQEIQTFRVTTGAPNSVSDLPVTLAFHPNGRSFVCTTKGLPYSEGIDRRRCSILIWSLDRAPGTASKPYVVTYRYTAETEAGGITSACLFESPSGKSYVLATSSPSSERASNGGEWSFISPVDTSGQGQTDLSPLIHRFEKLARHAALHDGAVPQRGNLVILLEKTGNIVSFPLIPDDHAGLSTPNVAGQEPVRLPVSLCPQHRLSMGSLRFDPSGTLLYAVDSKGKLIRASFAQEFPTDFNATRESILSPDLQELPSRNVFEIGESVDLKEPLRPDTDYTSSEGKDLVHDNLASQSILDKLKLRKLLRRR